MVKLVSFVLTWCAIFQSLQGEPQDSSVASRSLGGVAAVAGEFPWQVSLRTSASPNLHFCSGSLVSVQHVLTAAQCVLGRTASAIIAVTGTISLSEGGQSHAVRTVWPLGSVSNPAPGAYVNDVAVLLLNAPIVESALQRPLVLAIEDVPVGASVVSSQWGRVLDDSLPLTDLQKLEQTIVDSTACQTFWGNGGNIVDNHVCGEPVNGSGICNGDAGGALVFDNQVVGIVSWPNPCALGYPIVYTRVYPFIFWIGSLVHNTEIATTVAATTLPPAVTTPEPATTPSGQMSMAEGNLAMPILCLIFVAKRLVLSP